MGQKKTKIVLDADVIIHFMEADCFSLLPDIFPEYEYLILDVVYSEVSKNSRTSDFIDNYLRFFPTLRKEVFAPQGDSRKEFFSLQRTLGKGESACMIYCRKKMTKEECSGFMQAVNKAGSKLPIIDITQYACTVQI